MQLLDGKRAALLGVNIGLGLSAAAGAGVTPGAVYSDITTSTGTVLHNGGGTELGGVVTYTNMIADDLNLTGGGAVTQFTADIVNGNLTAVTFQPVFPFYENNGSSGGPGTILGDIFTPDITFSAGENELVTFDVAGIGLVVPSATIWAGLVFSNSGTPTTTAAELALLGQGTYNPPDVGSSLDRYFLGSSTNAPFTGSNPSGSITNFGGTPLANFGWEIVVPEPSASSAAMVILSGLLFARRRTRTI
jgi:hypothetical protein